TTTIIIIIINCLPATLQVCNSKQSRDHVLPGLEPGGPKPPKFPKPTQPNRPSRLLRHPARRRWPQRRRRPNPSRRAGAV
uniref:Uncharacterized protein n=1 Tax=Oryza glumipatula TaxID=40148 RepID=A0A0E0A4F2_9ORYZ